MLRLSRNGIGLLSAQYRSVLKKCLFLNFCAMAVFVPAAHAENYTPTSARLENMGTELHDSDNAYLWQKGDFKYNGNYGYNETEAFSGTGDAYQDAWLRNRGEVWIGYTGNNQQYNDGSDKSGTVIAHKHNITVSDGEPMNGGGAVSNMNKKADNDKNGILRIYKTDFNDNSVTSFTSTTGTGEGQLDPATAGTAAGGAISNYSSETATIDYSSFNNNYVMHLDHAAGGAIYNGSNVLQGGAESLGRITATNGTIFTGNYAGNSLPLSDSITTNVKTNIIDAWKNASTGSPTTGNMSMLATGGAIHNEGSFSIDKSRFENNFAVGIDSKGGAIYNGKNASFDNSGKLSLNGLTVLSRNYAGIGHALNYVSGSSNALFHASTALGGAIYNSSQLDIEQSSYNSSSDLDPDVNIRGGSDNKYAIFINNYTHASGVSEGGAIYNAAGGKVDAIRSVSLFQGNYAEAIGTGTAAGGAISNYGELAVQGGVFQKNEARSAGGKTSGGAIYNAKDGTIALDIDSSQSEGLGFNDNTAGFGGALYNEGTVRGNVKADALIDFSGNVSSARQTDGTTSNSVYNAGTGTVDITLTENAKVWFEQNQTVYNEGSFRILGNNADPTELGADKVTAMDDTEAGNTKVLLDTTFYSAESSPKYEIGKTNLVLSEYGYIDSTVPYFDEFSGINDTAMNLSNNTVTLESGSHMNLNSGNDILTNNDFDVAVNSRLGYANEDGNTGYLANTIVNKGRVDYYGHAKDDNLYVAKALANSSVLNVASDKLLANVHIDNLKSNEGNQIIVNLDNTAGNASGESSLIGDTTTARAGFADIVVIDKTIHNADGQITQIVFNDMSDKKIDQVNMNIGERIYFAQTQMSQTDYPEDMTNNTFATTAYNDNYEIKIGYEENGTVYDWFLYRVNDIDHSLDTALTNLPRAALEQTRSLLMPLSRTNRGQCSCYQDNCANSFCRYENGEPKARLWATPIYRKGNFDDPIDTDFTVKGIDFGIDYQHTHSDMIGVFGSYRNGKYENDGGKNDYYENVLGNKLEIDSLVGGLYYRKYFGNLYMLGAVYGGKLDVDAKTDIGASASVDGKTIGAQGEIGYDIRTSRRGVLTPSLRAVYSYFNFDDTENDRGEKVEYDNVNSVELEAALKYEYQFNNEYQLPTTGYIKPSVIQTISEGGDITIGGRKYDDNLKNETLGRVEVGADAEIIRNFSIGAFGNYTFGSNYSAWGVGGNIRYVW